MKIIFYLLTLAITFPAKVYSQQWSVSYFGNNLWNPGLSFEYDHSINTYYKVTQKDKKQLIKKNVNLKTGGFVDPGAYSLTFINGGFSCQRKYQNGRWVSINISPFGAARTFLPSTFLVNNDGIVSKESYPGRWYYAPSLDWQYGLFKGNGTMNRIFLGANFMFLFPYNIYAMPLFNIQIGYQLQKKK